MKYKAFSLIFGAVLVTASFSAFHFAGNPHSAPGEQYAGNKNQKDQDLRVMAYNIHHANPPSIPDSIDIEAIIRTIGAHEPDLVALQEIDVDTERSGAGNQAEMIGRRLGMHVFFGKAIDYDGGAYGVAILSRYPISEEMLHRLPTAPGTNGEPRVLATVKVSLPGKRFLRFGSTHLDSREAADNRLLQIREIARIGAEEELPMIIAGDFNAPPGSGVIDILDEHFSRTCIDCPPTIPVDQPAKAIDFIAYKPKESFSIKEHRVIDETYASDHLPILAVLRMK